MLNEGEEIRVTILDPTDNVQLFVSESRAKPVADFKATEGKIEFEYQG